MHKVQEIVHAYISYLPFWNQFFFHKSGGIPVIAGEDMNWSDLA